MCRLATAMVAIAMSASTVIGAQNDLANKDRQPDSPDSHTRLALRHLVSTYKGINDISLGQDPTRRYIRYLSFYDVHNDKDLIQWHKLLNWWVHQMSFEPGYRLPVEVPRSEGKLFAIDIRDYRWNPPAWQAVAARDVNFVQPAVNFKIAEQLRREMGYDDFTLEHKDDKTIPVLGVVSAMQFMRDTLETNRTQSYYDLLFATRRFTYQDRYKEVEETYSETQDWPGGVDPNNGKYYAPGKYTIQKKRMRKVQVGSVKFIDFPKNEAQLEEALGIDVVKAFAKKEYIDLDNGAIVAGGRDDPQNGSIVALQNRLVETLDGPLGPYMKTFDVLETSGIKDYSEALIFAGKRYRKGQLAKAVADAGEILFYLKNGGQGGILINGEGDRVEVANSAIANDTADKRLNAGVRTYGSCISCHASTGGFIPPRDLYNEAVQAGIDRKFTDREQANRVRAFFTDWQEGLKRAQDRYELLLKRTTAPLPGEGIDVVAWTGKDVTAVILEFRNRYDFPVDSGTAAAEMGWTEEQLKWICLRVGVSKPNEKGVVVQRNQRTKELVRGLKIPRSVWDKDVKLQLILLADAYNDDADWLKLFDKVVVPVP